MEVIITAALGGEFRHLQQVMSKSNLNEEREEGYIKRLVVVLTGLLI